MSCERCEPPDGITIESPMSDAAIFRHVIQVGQGVMLAENRGWLAAGQLRELWPYILSHATQPDIWTGGLVSRGNAYRPQGDKKPLAQYITLPVRTPIKVFLQPIFNQKRERVGQEALSRGVDADGNTQPFPWLKEQALATGSIFWLDRQCREASIRQGGHALGEDELLFVNFLPSVIYRPEHCLATTIEAMHEVGLVSSRLVLEVVESEEVDEGRLKDIVDFYRESEPGVRFALDDVGSGYSSLLRLERLRPDIVKLDMGITQNIVSNGGARAIAKAIREVAEAMGAIPLAEGLEDEATFNALIDLGYEWLQGYWLARPKPAQ